MKGGRYPPQIKFIIGNEACERFSYYGMMGILELYLKDRMQMGDDGATQVLHLFGTAVYFLPLLGGWLASYFLHMGDPVNGINVQSIVVAFIGAVIFVVALRLITGRRV